MRRILIGFIVLFSSTQGNTQTYTENFVKTTIPRAQAKSVQDVNSLSSYFKNHQITYSDGMGRTSQEITVEGSPAGNDMVSFVNYEANGEITKSYLPFTSKNNNGGFIASPVTTVSNFYQNTANIERTSFPFSEVQKEASLRNRTLIASNPGEFFEKNSFPNIHFTYRLNTGNPGDKIIKFNRANLLDNSIGFYPANELTVREVTDERNRKTIEFIDQFGNKVCQKVQITSNPITYSSLYFLYNDLNQLTYVLPPATSKKVYDIIDVNPINLNLNSFLNEFYQTKYDSRGRIIEKHVPGSGKTDLIYNDYDQLILSQNSNQKTSNKWTYYKYDYAGRMIIKGIFDAQAAYNNCCAGQGGLTLSTDLVRRWVEQNRVINISLEAPYPIEFDQAAAIQSMNGYTTEGYLTDDTKNQYFLGIDDYLENNEEDYTEEQANDLKDAIDELLELQQYVHEDLLYFDLFGRLTFPKAFYEEKSNAQGSFMGYSNKIFPTQNTKPVAVYYYDNYDFDGDNVPDQSFVANKYGELPSGKVKGELTGKSIKTLGTSTWLTTKFFYDELGQIIYSEADNQFTNKDYLHAKYDFEGNQIANVLVHYGYNSKRETITKKYRYDRMGRLLLINQKINEDDEIVLAQYRYNELGQLIEKNLHTEYNPSTVLVPTKQSIQSIDYEYNVRGWLKHINNADLDGAHDFGSLQKNPGAKPSVLLKRKINNVKFELVPVADYNNQGELLSMEWQFIATEEKEKSIATYSNNYSTINAIDENDNYSSFFGDSTETYTETLIDDERTIATVVSNSLENTELHNQLLGLTNTIFAMEFDEQNLNDFRDIEVYLFSLEDILVGELIEAGLDEFYATEMIVPTLLSEIAATNNNKLEELLEVHQQVGPDGIPYGTDLFGMDIMYYNKVKPISNKHFFNGNISEVHWKSAHDKERRGFYYNYDRAERLSSGIFDQYDYNTPAWTNPNKYFTNQLTYDENGNIQTLVRHGYLASTQVWQGIDDLTYHYSSQNENQLEKIIDTYTNDGFSQGSTSNQYTYDNMGNATQDLNSGIQTMTYDHFNNLTEMITTNGDKIIYTYDGEGNKLKMEVVENNITLLTQIYSGLFVYTDNTIEYIFHEEGRLVPNPNSWNEYLYEYYYHDHLGNIRQVFSDLNNDGYAVWSSEILQEQHYHPFGMQMLGLHPPQIGVHNPHSYNGNKWVQHLNIDLYDFNTRTYNPFAGRFYGVDKYASSFASFSGYSFGLNNPLKYSDPSGEFIAIAAHAVWTIGGTLGNLTTGVDQPFRSAWNYSLEAINDINEASKFPIYQTESSNVYFGLDFFSAGVSLNYQQNFSNGSASVGVGISLFRGPYANGGGSYSVNDNLSLSLGGGIGKNYHALGGGFDINGTGLSYYQTSYGTNTNNPTGISNAQKLGGVKFHSGEFSAKIENDFLAPGGYDRWRSNGIELSWGKFSIGTHLYNNDPANTPGMSGLNGPDSPIHGANRPGRKGNVYDSWEHGYVYNAPLYIGFKVGNSENRIGYSHEVIQDLTQNTVHKYLLIGRQHYYANYSQFRGGLYGYNNYYNPWSIWGR